MLNYKSRYIDTVGILVWTYYWFGKYSDIFGKPIISTFDGDGKLHWFILMHDPLLYVFGDMPVNHETGWLINYPRSYK